MILIGFAVLTIKYNLSKYFLQLIFVIVPLINSTLIFLRFTKDRDFSGSNSMIPKQYKILVKIDIIKISLIIKIYPIIYLRINYINFHYL